MTRLVPRTSPTSLLARLVESPDLVQTIRSLTPDTFAAVIRRIGVEDAGELLPLADAEQLVAAFDEDLFSSTGPGEAEVFDPAQFAVWLEVLMASGDAVAARFTELSDDFVVQAISSIAIVLDHDALLGRLARADRAARRADRAIEGALNEEIEGYLLVARNDEGWDALLALVLALDSTHRAYLERILDKAASLHEVYLDEPNELVTALTSAASLAEDVVGERQRRRGRRGFVDPQDARAFLMLARRPLHDTQSRDPISGAYFREFEATAPRPMVLPPSANSRVEVRALLETVRNQGDPGPSKLEAMELKGAQPFIEAMRTLRDTDPDCFSLRMQELGYLANVVLSAAKRDGGFDATQATEAAVLTCTLGAELAAHGQRASGMRAPRPMAPPQYLATVRQKPADILFRIAGGELMERGVRTACPGLISSPAELDRARSQLRGRG